MKSILNYPPPRELSDGELIGRLVFAGCGDLGGVSGDYLVLPGFTFSIQ